MRSPARLALPAALVVLLTGCVTIPTGPSVMVLPGSGKSFDQFRLDDTGRATTERQVPVRAS